MCEDIYWQFCFFQQIKSNVVYFFFHFADIDIDNQFILLFYSSKPAFD